MNMRPDLVTREAVDAALAAIQEYAHNPSERAKVEIALAAALPVLLGEPVAFINKRELKWIPRWGGPGSAVLSNKQTGKLVALYTLPTQDTPNADQ